MERLQDRIRKQTTSNIAVNLSVGQGPALAAHALRSGQHSQYTQLMTCLTEATPPSDPTSACGFHLGLARLLQEDGDTTTARAQLGKVVAVVPGDASVELLSSIADLCSLLGERQMADGFQRRAKQSKSSRADE